MAQLNSLMASIRILHIAYSGERLILTDFVVTYKLFSVLKKSMKGGLWYMCVQFSFLKKDSAPPMVGSSQAFVLDLSYSNHRRTSPVVFCFNCHWGYTIK